MWQFKPVPWLVQVRFLQDMLSFAEQTQTAADEWCADTEVKVTEELEGRLHAHRWGPSSCSLPAAVCYMHHSIYPQHLAQLRLPRFSCRPAAMQRRHHSSRCNPLSMLLPQAMQPCWHSCPWLGIHIIGGRSAFLAPSHTPRPSFNSA